MFQPEKNICGCIYFLKILFRMLHSAMWNSRILDNSHLSFIFNNVFDWIGWITCHHFVVLFWVDSPGWARAGALWLGGAASRTSPWWRCWRRTRGPRPGHGTAPTGPESAAAAGLGGGGRRGLRMPVRLQGAVTGRLQQGVLGAVCLHQKKREASSA